MDILGLVDVPAWLLGVVVLFFSLYLYSKWKHSYWKRMGVPGPCPTLFLGNLGAIRKKGVWGVDLKCVQKYGKVYGSYMGLTAQLNVADPEMVKELTVKRFSTFPNKWPMLPLSSELKGNLFNATDEHWKFMRSTLTPTFSSGKMRMTSPAIASCCEKLVDNIKEQSKDGSEVIEFKHVFGCYTMDVICSTGFGIDVNSQRDPNNEFVMRAKKTLQSFNVSPPLTLLAIIFPVLWKVFNLSEKLHIWKSDMLDVIHFFKKVTKSLIEDRKSGNEKRTDLLQIMLNSHNEAVDKEDGANMVDYKPGIDSSPNRGLTLDEVTVNSIVFMLAGYDTTANTLSFLAYNLALNPDCQEKCIEEVDRVLGKDRPNYDNVLKLEYLENCWNETLRMFDASGVTSRQANEDTVVSGYKIERSTRVNICIYAIHHDPEYWPEPDKFNPDRFLPEEKKKRHPYAFLPFGHGPRVCIGMRLANLEAKAAIATILQSYIFVKCEETEVPVELDLSAGFLIRAKNGIQLRVEQRF